MKLLCSIDELEEEGEPLAGELEVEEEPLI
jgi:hypothetical protein